jgi:hypothetical protein
MMLTEIRQVNIESYEQHRKLPDASTINPAHE